MIVLDVANRSERWKVVAVFNYSDKPAARTVDLKTAGLDTRHAYHAREFWTGAYTGVVREMLATVLEPHSCKVFALRRQRNVPQVVGTDMHLTQGGTEIVRTAWNTAGRLEIILKTYGPKNGNLFVALPENFSCKKIMPANIGASQLKKGMLCLEVSEAKQTKIVLTFKKSKGAGAQSREHELQ